MLFLTLKSVKVNFVSLDPNLSLYNVAETFLIIRQIQLIEKKTFIIITFDLKDKAFVVYIVFIA